ncbi:MAG: efflux RND transporter permease subunit [Candidatus Scalindua sp.]
MIQHLNQLRQEGLGLHEAILKGAEDRLRPVLMTALTTALGFIPILLSHVGLVLRFKSRWQLW